MAWGARNLISTQVKRLIAPERFPAKMAEFKREHLGPCRLSGPLFGTERFALEHWVHSHPRCSPCDASASAKQPASAGQISYLSGSSRIHCGTWMNSRGTSCGR